MFVHVWLSICVRVRVWVCTRVCVSTRIRVYLLACCFVRVRLCRRVRKLAFAMRDASSVTLLNNCTLCPTRAILGSQIPRLVRMHSDEMEDVDSVSSGEIVAMFGVDCHSGDTFNGVGINYAMTSMFVPEPVISYSIKPTKSAQLGNFSKVRLLSAVSRCTAHGVETTLHP